MTVNDLEKLLSFAKKNTESKKGQCGTVRVEFKQQDLYTDIKCWTLDRKKSLDISLCEECLCL